MKVQIIETKQVAREADISLPYCARDGKTFYRINPDGSTLRVCNYNTWVNIELSAATDSEHNRTLQKILSLTPCDDGAVMEALEEIHAIIATHATDAIVV